MSLWGLHAVIPGRESGDAALELKTAQTYERYKVSDHFLFLPSKGFSQRYIALADIRGVIPGVTRDSEDSVLVSYSVELPNLRVMYENGFELLSFEHKKNADLMAGILRQTDLPGRRS